MSTPIVTVTHSAIRPGHAGQEAALSREVARLVEEKEPQILGFYTYLDAERARLVTVQVHPDAESMTTHTRVISEQLQHATEALDLERATMYSLGDPPDDYLGWVERFGARWHGFPTPIAAVNRLGGGSGPGGDDGQGAAAPTLWIAKIPVVEGKADDYAQAAREVVQVVEDKEPGALAFFLSFDAAREYAIAVEVYADAEALAAHLQDEPELAARVGRTIDLARGSFTAIGPVPQRTLDFLASMGVTPDAYPTPVVAITRHAAPAGAGA